MKTGNAIRELTEAAPVIGWRVWIVTATADGLRLGSVLHDQFWKPGTTALASCQRHDDLFAEPIQAHGTPSLECGCGFHAARDPADALSYLQGRNEPATVCRLLGEVALWGRLVETEAGWRAAAAYPVRLYVADDAIAEALSVYDVPVHLPRTSLPRFSRTAGPRSPGSGFTASHLSRAGNAASAVRPELVCCTKLRTAARAVDDEEPAFRRYSELCLRPRGWR